MSLNPLDDESSSATEPITSPIAVDTRIPRKNPVVRPTFVNDPCTSSEADDVRLVRLTLEGDQKAFGTLVRRYQTPLYNLALRMTGDQDDAKDITQAAFVKAFENISTFDESHRFFSWLYRIGMNEALNFRRAADRHDSLEIETPGAGENPEEEFQRKRVQDSVQKAVFRLSPDHRAVVLLRHFNEMSYEEMSYALGIPVKTVKSRLYSARQTLAGLLT